MAGVRAVVADPGGLSRLGRAGDNRIELIVPQIIATDAVDTLTVAKLSAGLLAYTGFTAARAAVDAGRYVRRTDYARSWLRPDCRHSAGLGRWHRRAVVVRSARRVCGQRPDRQLGCWCHRRGSAGLPRTAAGWK